MKFLNLALILMPVLAVADISPTALATATAVTATAAAKPKKAHAFMLGDKLVVTGSSLGLGSEGEARLLAVKDAAATAADFLELEGLGKSMDIRTGVENAVLRETPLVAQDFDQVRIEDIRQENWSNVAGIDKWSAYLVLSIRVSKKHKHKAVK